jgi:uncharacterized sulfatase
MQYVDLAPTFLEAAGADPATIDTGCPDASGRRGFDGRSLLPVLLGNRQTHRDIVFAQHTTVGINGYRQPYPMRAARDARYKLIRNLAPNNTYWIAGIHKGEPLESWVRDARHDPKLAARIEWLSHRPADELYDLQADPFEMHNIAGDPRHAATKQRLGKALDAWMAQQGDQGMQAEENALMRQPRHAKSNDAPKKRKNQKTQ